MTNLAISQLMLDLGRRLNNILRKDHLGFILIVTGTKQPGAQAEICSNLERPSVVKVMEEILEQQRKELCQPQESADATSAPPASKPGAKPN